MTETVLVKRLKLDPATGLPIIEAHTELQRKTGNVAARAEHLSQLAKKNYLGPKRPAEDYVKEATEQVVAKDNTP